MGLRRCERGVDMSYTDTDQHGMLGRWFYGHIAHHAVARSFFFCIGIYIAQQLPLHSWWCGVTSVRTDRRSSYVLPTSIYPLTVESRSLNFTPSPPWSWVD
jgi:hypothetical protein